MTVLERSYEVVLFFEYMIVQVFQDMGSECYRVFLYFEIVVSKEIVLQLVFEMILLCLLWAYVVFRSINAVIGQRYGHFKEADGKKKILQ
jgi:hypothetical protein